MLIKAIIYMFKCHDINPDESIVKDTMLDKRNWLCKCHRCGLYEMHDGAVGNLNITLTKSQAYRTKMEFERDVLEFQKEGKRWKNQSGREMQLILSLNIARSMTSGSYLRI